MIVLRRTPFRKPVPPPSLARVRQMEYEPRARAAATAAPVVCLVEPIPKDAPLRSEKYRRYVASFPCFGCGIVGFSQCAHTNAGRGLGQKASDAETFPLCSVRPGHIGCHQQFDLLLGYTLVERRALEVAYVARMQAQARADGWPV